MKGDGGGKEPERRTAADVVCGDGMAGLHGWARHSA
jgi:hypothetical protein